MDSELWSMACELWSTGCKMWSTVLTVPNCVPLGDGMLSGPGSAASTPYFVCGRLTSVTVLTVPTCVLTVPDGVLSGTGSAASARSCGVHCVRAPDKCHHADRTRPGGARGQTRAAAHPRSPPLRPRQGGVKQNETKMKQK
jgi:hypothetical protein